MKKIISIPLCNEIYSEYESENIKNWLKMMNCDAFEVIRCDEDSKNMFTKDVIEGVHMRFYSTWINMYKFNEKMLIDEYGDLSTAYDFLKCENFSGIMEEFKKDLEYAQKIGAKYVVFHISEVTINEVYTYNQIHTDEEVIKAAAEIINELLDNKNYDFYFLMENLWWSGLKMTSPKLTKMLLDLISYDKKGIMLDTGHLLCTNINLKNQKDGCTYINKILDEFDSFDENLISYIKGIHLHQSISGEYVKKMLDMHIKKGDDYYENFFNVYKVLQKIDTHEPWIEPKIKNIVERINPKWLVHEIKSCPKNIREEKIKQQNRLL